MKIISKWMGVILLASSALFTTNVMAQDLKKPTLEDLIPGGFSVVGTLVSLASLIVTISR